MVSDRTSDLKSLASGDSEHVALWHRVCNEVASEEQQWIANLRSIGIKAAHPDDGWVARNSSQHHDFVTFQYPQFNDGPKVGDLIALGGPDRYRVRKVLGVREVGLLNKTAQYQVAK